ncbi:MAG TPA: 2Fe-2S iron-sulfur cluster-binding protein [Bacteroidales bacterium]|nr:2Fe-2S iron-sulfur cluster-binding protein [Bacteroidales bacterium]
MNKLIKLNIDGKECMATKGQYIVEAARENDIYIPTLCNIPNLKPRGACRICTVNVNGKLMTSCTTPVSEGMVVETSLPEIVDLRKSIVELLFVEGNHFCPSCERSGNCELQALAYRFRMMVPRFPYRFQQRNIEASNSKLIKDHNRCILCKRCIRAIKDEEGRGIFAFKRRGHQVEISIDPELAKNLTDELADKAAEICPVGALLRKEKGYETPIGERKYDKTPIGSEIEKFAHSKP